MKKLFFILSLILTSLFLSAQSDYLLLNEAQIKQHAIYAELAGSSIIYSLNYDYTFVKDNKLNFNLGLGFAYLGDGPNSGPGFSSNDNMMMLTPQINFLKGIDKHYLEYGLSTPIIIPGLLSIGGRVGYRYQPKDGGFLFRAGFTPILLGGSLPIPWAGLSFGYTF